MACKRHRRWTVFWVLGLVLARTFVAFLSPSCLRTTAGSGRCGRQALASSGDVEVMKIPDEFEEEDEEELELPTFMEKTWWVSPSSWPPEAAELFVALGPHEAATRFLCEAPVAPWLQATLYNALCELPVNEYDLQALLYPAGSHLFTAAQLQQLLGFAGVARPLSRVLDVGSGDGCHTAELRKLSDEVVVAETSQGMAWHLQQQGYKVWCEDISATAAVRSQKEKLFSLVSVLNVLDRCASPSRLLAAASTLLEHGGHLLLASPLPFAASYYGPETSWNGEPLEALNFSQASWEEDGLVMIQELLPSLGFQVKAVSRLPYLSGGDVLDGGCIELDDIIILAQKVPK